jgi:hypothetical protein
VIETHVAWKEGMAALIRSRVVEAYNGVTQSWVGESAQLLYELLLSTAHVSKGINDVKDKAGLGVCHPISGGETVSSFSASGRPWVIKGGEFSNDR